MTSQNGQTPFNNLAGNTADLKVVFFDVTGSLVMSI